MSTQQNPLAVVTGASSGIGYELAREAVARGYDLVIAADQPAIHDAARSLSAGGAVKVNPIECDLSTTQGVGALYDRIKSVGRPVDALLANAGIGLGGGFLDQEPDKWRKVVDTNVTGTLDLVQRVGRDLRARGSGHIMIVGSIAGFMPGSFQAVYNGTKAFLDSFSFALRNELKDAGVTVTCLMPGVTDTEFFARAEMLDTNVGQGKKDDPAFVAHVGWEAMLKGQGDIVSGWHNKLQSLMANILPAGLTAEGHRHMAQPKSDGR